MNMKTTLVVSKKILIVSLLLNAAIAQADFVKTEKKISEDELEAVVAAAYSGNAVAQNKLGVMFLNGEVIADPLFESRIERVDEGVERDRARAFKWFARAAKEGLPEAQYNLGLMYIHRCDWEIDDNDDLVLGGDSPSLLWDKLKEYNVKGTKWFRKAAEQGYAPAQYELAQTRLFVVMDDAEHKMWMQKAAEQGYAPAQYELGGIHYVDDNYLEAFKWCLKAAAQGYLAAQFELGEMYKSGKGVEKDLKTAYNWYKKASEQDAESSEWGYQRGDAQSNLADMYYEGKAVPKDYAEAAKWYRKAAENGNVHASNKLGEMYLNGVEVTKDYAEAFRLFCEATDGYGDDSMEARYNLGYMYEHGLGVKKDMNAARQWYMKAAEQGHVEAQKALAR